MNYFNRISLIIISLPLLLLLSACESGWHYLWTIENRSGRPVRMELGDPRGYRPQDIAWRTETIPNDSSLLLFEEHRINSGPCPGTHPFELRIYDGDMLILSETRGEAKDVWKSLVRKNSLIFPSYTVDMRLIMVDTGVVSRERCDARGEQ